MIVLKILSVLILITWFIMVIASTDAIDARKYETYSERNRARNRFLNWFFVVSFLAFFAVSFLML